MGRSRRRQRREPAANSTQEQATESPVKLMPEYVTVLPGGLTVEPMVEAPVLALDGLDPWSPIAGPALALEDPPDGTADAGATYASPHQLELEPWSPDTTDAAETHAAQADAGDDEAPAEAEPFVPQPPDPSEQLYARARGAADDGRLAEAMALYRELIAQNPRHLRARNNLALLLDGTGDHQGALAELDRALELDAEHTTLLTNRGALLVAQGRYAAAERDLRRVLRVEPSNVEALFNLGVTMTKKGLWSEAAPHLRRATELDPSRGPAFYYLGESLNHVDDLAGALTAYQRAAELQPTNPRALYGLGIIYDRLARPDDAAMMYRKSREVGRR